jgi:hypothetical protein
MRPRVRISRNSGGTAVRRLAVECLCEGVRLRSVCTGELRSALESLSAARPNHICEPTKRRRHA